MIAPRNGQQRFTRDRRSGYRREGESGRCDEPGWVGKVLSNALCRGVVIKGVLSGVVTVVLPGEIAGVLGYSRRSETAEGE